MKKYVFIIIAYFLLVYILPLGWRPLIIPDETRYGEIPREMIATGDWVTPRLDGLRYFEKPVLGYWIVASSISVFGENAFALRLPSAASVGLSALLVFLLVRRFAGRPEAAALAAIVFITFFEVYGVGVTNVLDGMLAFFITAAMVFFFLAYQEDRPARKNLLLALFGVFAGLAFLTKGFIGLVVPGLIVALFMVYDGRWKELLCIAWTPLAAALLVALPWAVMIHLREPDYWRYFVVVEHFQRFAAENAQHEQPFWYYLAVIAGGALPFGALFPAAVAGLRGNHSGPDARLLRFSYFWLLAPFVFFSISRGKLATYILPCFPPLAVIMTLALLKYFDKGKTRAFKAGSIVLAVFPVLLGVWLALSATTDLFEFNLYGRGETWKWVLMEVGLGVWAVLALLSGRASRPWTKLALVAAAPVCFLFLLQFSLPAYSLSEKAPGRFFSRWAGEIRPGDRLFTDSDLLHSACWFLKREDVYLLSSPGELAYGLDYDDSRHRLLSIDEFRALVRTKEAGRRFVVITTLSAFESWKEARPDLSPGRIVGEDGFVLAVF